jgi:uncharacterized protein
MLYVVLFTDDPAHGDIRPRLMPSHLAFLERHGKTIHLAGPLYGAQDGEAQGGLWVVEAETLDAVRALVEADPFWPTGLRQAVRILRWSQVFADGRRLV